MKENTFGLDSLFLTFEQFTQAVVAYLPTFFSAVAVLASGFIVAWILKAIVLRISAAISMLFSRAAGGESPRLVRLPWPLSVIIANIIFWLTAVFFLAVSSRILGLPGIADWIAAAARYLPNVVAAAAIVLGGTIVASLTRDALMRFGEHQALGGSPRALANLAFFMINLVAVLAALRQMGIDLVLVRSLVLIMAGAAFGGIAFAFGMGASSSLDNIIAGYYVRRLYRQGQRVRLGVVEGEILDLTPTAVVMDTPGGRALVPARKFNQEVSVLLGQEEDDNGQ